MANGERITPQEASQYLAGGASAPDSVFDKQLLLDMLDEEDVELLRIRMGTDTNNNAVFVLTGCKDDTGCTPVNNSQMGGPPS